MADNTAQEATTDTPQDGVQTFDADYVQKLRQEAAKYRTQYREASSQLKDLQPLAEKYQEVQEAQKTEAQKMAEQLATFKAAAEQAKAEAAQAQRRAKLTMLASQAGVSAEVLPFLSVDAFDLDNDEAALAALGKLAQPKAASGGTVSNPSSGDAKQESDEERRARLFGGRPTYIFGAR